MIYHRWATPIEHSSNHIGMQPIRDHLLTYYNVSDTISDNYNIFDDESKPIENLKDMAYATHCITFSLQSTFLDTCKRAVLRFHYW